MRRLFPDFPPDFPFDLEEEPTWDTEDITTLPQPIHWTGDDSKTEGHLHIHWHPPTIVYVP